MTSNFFILLSFFLLSIFSVIGYGTLFSKIFSNNLKLNYGYKGLYGLFFLILYSYLSHYLIPHGIIHNTIIIVIGLSLFFYFQKKKFDFFSLKITLINFLILFIALLIFKTHDDFPYYHFGYSFYLTQDPMMIGIGQFNHGLRTPSSIFYLNSLYFLPYIKYFSFYIPTLLILGFSNLIIIFNIKKHIRKKNFDFLFYLNIFFLVFINIFFYRLQEHGTDRSAQILIAILFIEIFYFLTIIKNKKQNISNIFIILGTIISLKAFYILYLVLLLPIAFIIYKNRRFDLVDYSFKNSYFYAFGFLLLTVISVYFFNTGCFLYPVSFTCFDNFDWSIGVDRTLKMNEHYQLWSKAGKTPNFKISNPELYLKDFNWLPNWIDLYFFNKVSDFLLGLTVLVLIIFVLFYKKSSKKVFLDKKIKNFFIIYLFILILFFEWFLNHPALRYGGYVLIALLLFIPFSIFLEINQKKSKEIILRLKILILVTIIIFLFRNIQRIDQEVEKYDYKPLKITFYNVDKSHFRIQRNFDLLISNYHNCKKKIGSCDEGKKKKVKEILPNRYMFIYD